MARKKKDEPADETKKSGGAPGKLDYRPLDHVLPGQHLGETSAKPHSLKDAIRNLFKDLETTPKKEIRLQSAWEECAGPKIAAHTRASNLVRNTLWVYVDSSPWLMELESFGPDDLIAKLQAKGYDVKFIKYKIGELT